MSRGWESKSVEEQQAQAATPKPEAEETSAETSADIAERKRMLQSLELQRERILSERTSSPHRRSALTNALADIEEKLAELGWSVHL
jgi:chromosome segregation ATPase